METKQINKLYKEISILSHKLNGNTQLDEHQRCSIINDTLIKLIQKEKEGVVKLNDYETEYKHYMFTILNNFLLQHFQSKKRHKNIIINKSIDITNEDEYVEQYQPEDDIPFQFTESQLELIRTTLKEKEYKVFSYLIEGVNQNKIAVEMNLSVSNISLLTSKVKRKLKLILTQPELFNKIQIDENINLYKYQVIDVITKQVSYANTHKEVGELVGLSKRSITNYISVNRFLFKNRYRLKIISK